MRKGRNVRRFTVVLERDQDGVYVASVPILRGCHTQAKTLDPDGRATIVPVHKGGYRTLPV